MLNVHSIFTSIDGEVNAYHQGRLTTFLRLSSCNLRCSFCDTRRAQLPGQGRETPVEEVLDRVDALGVRKLTITGGEPLLQKEGLRKLFQLIVERHGYGHYRATVETNGSIYPAYDLPVSWVVDYKLPSSQMEGRMSLENFLHLGPQDWVKFVISDRADFDRALEVWGEIIRKSGRTFSPGVAFSPAGGERGLPQKLVEWMKEKKLDAVFSLQIHRLLWPEGETGDDL